jgi:hypothetical protein
LASSVDLLGELAQLVLAAQADGLAEVAAAEALDAGTDLLQRAEEVVRQLPRQAGEHQQHDQRHPADHARPLHPGLRVQPEADGGAVGGAAHEQLVRVMSEHGAGPLGRRAPVDRRAFDLDHHRQALGQGLGPRDVRRIAEVPGQAVDVVGHQRLDHVAPAGTERALHAEHEGAADGQRQGQEQHDEAQAQRVAHAAVPASMP